MKFGKIFLGKLAERIAVAYLRARRYQIWKRNAWSGGAEVDVLGFRQGTLFVCEVRSWRAGRLAPLEAMSWEKEKRLFGLAQRLGHRSGLPVRVLLLAVDLRNAAGWKHLFFWLCPFLAQSRVKRWDLN